MKILRLLMLFFVISTQAMDAPEVITRAQKRFNAQVCSLSRKVVLRHINNGTDHELFVAYKSHEGHKEVGISSRQKKDICDSVWMEQQTPENPHCYHALVQIYEYEKHLESRVVVNLKLLVQCVYPHMKRVIGHYSRESTWYDLSDLSDVSGCEVGFSGTIASVIDPHGKTIEQSTFECRLY